MIYCMIRSGINVINCTSIYYQMFDFPFFSIRSVISCKKVVISKKSWPSNQTIKIFVKVSPSSENLGTFRKGVRCFKILKTVIIRLRGSINYERKWNQWAQKNSFLDINKKGATKVNSNKINSHLSVFHRWIKYLICMSLRTDIRSTAPSIALVGKNKSAKTKL